MKVKLENREYELKANGRFLLKYQEKFNGNAILDLYKCAAQKDVVAFMRLVYCGIDEEMSFEDWCDSFETPFFILPIMDEALEYFVRSVNPTVESKGSSSSNEKKTTD